MSDQWPVYLGDLAVTEAAVRSSMNNLIGYPIKKDRMSSWDEYISADRQELIKVFTAWRRDV